MRNLKIHLFTVICLFGANLFAESFTIPLESPPPIKNRDSGIVGRMEKESYKDINQRYRDCMNRDKDRAKCENEKMKPGDKYIFEYKK